MGRATRKEEFILIHLEQGIQTFLITHYYQLKISISNILSMHPQYIFVFKYKLYICTSALLIFSSCTSLCMHPALETTDLECASIEVVHLTYK